MFKQINCISTKKTSSYLICNCVLWINIELVNKQSIWKCLTLSYCENYKNVTLPAKELKRTLIIKISFLIIIKNYLIFMLKKHQIKKEWFLFHFIYKLLYYRGPQCSLGLFMWIVSSFSEFCSNGSGQPYWYVQWWNWNGSIECYKQHAENQYTCRH